VAKTGIDMVGPLGIDMVGMDMDAPLGMEITDPVGAGAYPVFPTPALVVLMFGMIL